MKLRYNLKTIVRNKWSDFCYVYHSRVRPQFSLLHYRPLLVYLSLLLVKIHHRERLPLSTDEIVKAIRELHRAFKANVVPNRSLIDLLLPISDPKLIHWHGNFDYELFSLIRYDHCLPIGTSLVTQFQVAYHLLAAGAFKRLGEFGSAETLYLTMREQGCNQLRSWAWLGLGDLCHTAWLWRDQIAREGDISLIPLFGGLEHVLKRVLRWNSDLELDFESAAHCYRQALSQPSPPPLAWYELFRLHHRAGAHEEAKHCLDRYEAALPSQTALVEIERFRAFQTDQAFPLSGCGSSVADRRRYLRVSDVRPQEFNPPGVSRLTFLASEHLDFTYKVYHNRETLSLRRSHATLPQYCHQVDHMRLVAPAYCPIVQDRWILTSSQQFDRPEGISIEERQLYEPNLVGYHAEESTIAVPKTPETVVDRVIVLPGLSFNYFHFLFDTLGALALIPPGELSARSIFLPNTPRKALKSFHRALFKKVGISTEQIIDFENSPTNLVFTDAILPAMPGRNNTISPVAVRFLRQAMALAPSGRSRGRRIYFERTQSRKAANAERIQLHAMLRRYDVEVFDPLSLTIDEQIALVATASWFITDAGAAVANVLYANEGTHVVILATHFGFRDFFSPLLMAMGVHTHIVVSDVMRIYPRHFQAWSTFTPSLNLDALENCLATLAAESSWEEQRA